MIPPELFKVKVIKTFSQPATKKQIRAFLRITGYYRKLTPNYSALVAPLTNLTKENRPTKVTWTSDYDSAFQVLKTCLCASAVLKSPNFTKLCILQTDVSDRGVGAVLSQPSIDNDIHPVAYFCKKLFPWEERFSLHHRKRVSCSKTGNKSLLILSHGMYIYSSN